MTQKIKDVKAALAVEVRPFEKLAPPIHEKTRLAIVSVLAANQPLRFVDLRDGLGLTDGNLAAHLKVLDAAGLVRIDKVGKAPLSVTTISLSPIGRRAFSRYLEGLEQIVKRHR